MPRTRSTSSATPATPNSTGTQLLMSTPGPSTSTSTGLHTQYDPINHIVFEYDEPHHFGRIYEDKDREQSIFTYFRMLNIKIRFIRYSEFENKFYEIFESQKI